MKENKSILIIGAGEGQLPAIKQAKDMGLYVVSVDYNPNSIGFKYSDEYKVISTKDIDRVVDFAVKFNKRKILNGVMTCGAEVAETVSAVADSLKLPGVPVEVAKNATDKLRRIQIFKEQEVPSPDFFYINSINDIEKFNNKINYPVVVKPIDKAGAKGVKRCNNYLDLKENIKEAQSSSGNPTILIEEYFAGPEISTEAIVYNGKIYTTGFADRNYDKKKLFAPYFIEDGHTIPSVLSEEMQEKVISVTEKAIKALGIKWGVAKGDIIIHDGEPRVLEMAARLSGGRFATDMVPLATGIDIVKVLIKISIGEEINPEEELTPKFNKGAAQRFFLHTDSGVVKCLEGITEARNSRGIYDLAIEKNIKKGDKIEIIRSHHDRLLHVIATGKDRKEAVNNAENAISKIKIKFTKE
ncbi:ATP-grasp domain-containing protein [Iocasia frigidifontis]|uniref:ATP-grasp domain-containing protein n=1 Tax=Iocasia fonsfrigidae TaxID=2682810 RepID=A0A8A7KA26_9FIRM|nr:ATP-grasp domain-containing protein [Iocasia fonsfrigidae]QTL96945.1 ATP-grasp domain-containing protein [Iocasia fonsfrigidae]